MVRLGRVCYIVKESSIDLGERALKELEQYAIKKHVNEWEKLNELSASLEQSSVHLRPNFAMGQEENSPQSNGPQINDAIEDYFNN